jgi:hypothetical protein
MTEYIYVVQMDIPPEREDDFNRIYDTQHVPEITKVPGVLGVTRYKLEQSSEKDMPTYLAIYRCASADIPQNAAWKAASDTGDWKEMIRPHTTNRRHSIFRELP